MGKKRKVFISYRRSGGQDVAAYIESELGRRYGVESYLDVEEIYTGNFSENIASAIKDCDLFLLIISEGSIKRFKDPEDISMEEVKLAMDLKKPILPINLIGEDLYTRDYKIDGLPKWVEELKKYNTKKYTHETKKHIISYIGETLLLQDSTRKDIMDIKELLKNILDKDSVGFLKYMNEININIYDLYYKQMSSEYDYNIDNVRRDLLSEIFNTSGLRWRYYDVDLSEIFPIILPLEVDLQKMREGHGLSSSISYELQRYEEPHNMFKEIDNIYSRYLALDEEIDYIKLIIEILLEEETEALEKLLYKKEIIKFPYESKNTLEFYKDFKNYLKEKYKDVLIYTRLSEEKKENIKNFYFLGRRENWGTRYKKRARKCLKRCELCIIDKNSCISNWILEDIIRIFHHILTTGQEDSLSIEQYCYTNRPDVKYGETWRYVKISS
ncbi:TIR domain-containing protein [Natronincola peptidivorans]|uniref:TIR domain-containing protein n=1 Tax=Natronincola peptidivorans TaxID=426128 RepID=A0A1I0EJR8_9FIRM|nr:toll/interleukin-1 receptor domain-containing protein [Natronincola peptidivorans]SET45666.1 TIR domain-containing protein [Natronincola peptidivorans]